MPLGDDIAAAICDLDGRVAMKLRAIVGGEPG